MASGEKWTNYAESVSVAELGPDEYERRYKKQEDLFKRASEKGNVLDNVSIGWKKIMLSSGTGVDALMGIGAQGYAKVVEELDMPRNCFFTPGRLFEIRARHSNFPDTNDDTKLGVRLLSVKFADHEKKSPLDLICFTGSISSAFNANSYSDMLKGLSGDTETRKKYLLSLPVYLDAHMRGMRKLPDSYYHQHYYSQIVYEFKDDGGDQWLAKFRIIPADGSGETGMMSEEAQREAWNMDPLGGLHKGKDYLRQAFSARLHRENVHYLLQIQLHAFYDDGTVDYGMYNCSTDWPIKDHPWIDLMNISLMSELSTDISQCTCFNIFNYPRGVLCIPEPVTQYDYSMIPHLRGHSEISDKEKALLKYRGSSVQYNITVFTGMKKESGTDDEIYISIIGTKGRTSFHKLGYFLEDDFERGSSRLYRVNDKDVHDIACIKIRKEPHGQVKHDWYLSYITVYSTSTLNEKKIYIFPCYRWMTNTVTTISLQEGKGALPQLENNPYLKLQRNLEVQENQDIYKWQKRGLDPGFKDLPGYIDAMDDLESLPKDAKFEGMKKLENKCMKLNEAPSMCFEKLKNTFGDVASFFRGEDAIQEKESFLKSTTVHSNMQDYIVKHWRNDEEFGRQILQGVNPTKIKRIKELPENFPVTEESVLEGMKSDKSLSEEMKAGKVYLLSYPELDDFITMYGEKQHYMCAPMCLLYVRENKLIPIAIQLTQTPSQHTPIFTKKDDQSKYSDWLVAKMWVRVADSNYHQFITHLLETHLLMEPVAMAMMRNLPSMHPAFKLLKPHLHSVMAANTLIRKFLLPHGKALSQVLAVAEEPCAHMRFLTKEYQEYMWTRLGIPQELDTRGVQESSLLPGYCYRDDALLLWYAIEEFVDEIIRYYYKADIDVEADSELRNMLKDMATNGFHYKTGVPATFDKVDDFVQFLTSIIFCCSCQHAAVTSGQLDTYGFIPNSPTCLLMPPPKEKCPEGLDEATMKKLLPTPEINQRVIGLARMFSKCSKQEPHLGDYPEKLFTDPEAQAAIQRFQSRLKDISAIIHNRNAELEVPYWSLLPERVPNSTNM